jgi:hypothetical protein
MGYGRKVARFFAGFFYVSMMTVCGLFGLLDGRPESSSYLKNGAGGFVADARAGPFLSAPLIQRR